ncbi:PEP-CTERM sorting domain-containing protein [Plectonema cf. radiosum LEGE 06105]|uniref:PEP-CTERM sorting domain-containing protein n=1 Tax=Plectonema cf. radiosum LEGE 06105 TaxID=945769 RepID=A0A8J7EZA4_9CYAN|nr:exosortase-dependent surface protein XDP2 [Plectonema radiosum]MBE9211425.1 PEP-CTERM sorting domain-containing protein [Plectonema cf. radiosum LEGE 06105]
MKFNQLITSIGLTASTVLFISNSAQAANFTTNISKNDGPKGDILLESIEQNGKLINQFSFVERAEILYNTEKIAGVRNSGAASTDKGKYASPNLTTNEDPEAFEIAQFLGNNNLNNIIDTEDTGSFKLNLFFDNLIRADNTGLDSLFFWERGMNSDLLVQAIDDQGNIIGNAIKLLRKEQQSAGFEISTLEIGNNIQDVGSWGVSLDQLGVTNLSGIQIYADQSFNGPDFKVIARKSQGHFAVASVPEPGTIIALGSVAALAFVRRRKSV